MPKNKEVVSNKGYCDIIYAYLQTNCDILWKDKQAIRKVVYKKNINFTQIGKALNLSRQTVATKIKNLIALGLVLEEEDLYELVELEKTGAFLVHTPTLVTLTVTTKEDLINTYIYLLNRYIANKDQKFVFYLADIKKFLGLSPTNKHNNFIIKQCLNLLNSLGLVETKEIEIGVNGTPVVGYELIRAVDRLPR